MLSLKVHLLGTPDVRRGESPVAVKRRKVTALLAYLAVTGRGHTREALATLLWPEAGAVRSHANLRNLLWILKREIAPIELSADYETVELARESVWTDVGEFRERSRAARGTDGRGADIFPRDATVLAGCVDLYRDHFMAGFGLKENYAFEEWQLHERETLRIEFASVLERLVRFHRKRGEPDRAILYGRRRLALDPFHEPAQRELMDLYAEAGRRSSAIELYEQSTRLLEKELGLTPTEETTELRDRILSSGLARFARAPDMGETRHNLPSRKTRFVGREEEMDEIRRLLADPDRRLLTLVGPGGSGKTRLAIQAAEERLGDHPDGVFFVSLVSVDSPRKRTAALVEALRVPLPHREREREEARRRAGPPERGHLLDYLRGKRMLLVLDNMEHLLDDMEDVRAILEEAPEVRILATSRERLQLSGEHVLELEGLPYPPEGTDREEYGSFDAVRLFLSAARRANVSFAPDEEDEEAIARICRRLRGGPLGIELAAAWIKMFRCAEIDREIEKSFDFLTSRGRNLPDRHRSLRAVFDNSWDLLSEKERTCFRRIAAFRGGFTREAARETAGCSIRVLESLGDKSLLRTDSSGRYEIHEVLRRYAEEKLRGNEEEREALLDRLSAYHLERLAGLRRAIEGRKQRAALREIARESENIHLAWLRAARQKRYGEMENAFFPLFLFFDIHSRFSEGADLFGEAIRIIGEKNGRKAAAILGALHTGRAWYVRYDRIGLSEESVRRGAAILTPLGRNRFFFFNRVVSAILFAGGIDEEKERLEEAYAFFDEAGEKLWAAMALEVLGYIHAETDREAALRYGQRSLRLRHGLGDRWGIALSHDLLGRIADIQNMPRVAKKRYWESVKIRREMGEDLDGAVCIMERIATQARRTGEFDEAYRLLQECIRLSREMGHRWRIAYSRTRLGMIAYDMGRGEEAREELESAVDLAQHLDDTSWINLLYAILANIALVAGDSQEARFRLEQIADPEEETPVSKNPPVDIRSVRGNRNAWLDLGFGRLAAEEGNGGKAMGRFRNALRLAAEAKDEPTALEALGEIARVRFAGGDAGGAGRLLGFLLGREELTPNARTRAEGLRKEMSRRLKAAGLREAMAPGRADEYDETVLRESEEREG